ncbi:MAG: Smr/MutS family protein [Rhodobacter sp.]|nr:Smr/MutS family protein [Paracoccaceae bacterium]MCC0077654.1 Smr/MutS family protein [Rhodobacter sp.]
MPRRRVTDDERELWHRVARTARRLAPSPSPEADTRKGPVPDPAAPRPPGPPPPATVPTVKRRPHPPATPPRVALDLAEPVSDHLARQPVQMDRNLHTRMMRGKLEPEARIDLHGMTVAQAHHALMGFMLSAQARGLRLVLVITGKGRAKGPDHAAPMPVRAGVLKHEVPQWLRGAPLASMVLELRESHRSHGGSGAYYVYLRKRR